MFSSFRFSILLLALGALFGCDCTGPQPVAPNGDPSEADAGCHDDTCGLPPEEEEEEEPDGGVVDDCAAEERCGEGACCADDEECVEDYQCAPSCEGARCGDNGLECCAAGQVCLDGVVCAAACEEGQPLCGASLDVCCESGDVCLYDACVTPGAICADDFDCLTSDTYCEPTIGRCLAEAAPPRCELEPSVDRLSLEVKRHWPGVTVDGKLYVNIMTTPVVGDVSGDGIPDIVVPAYVGATLSDSVLVAIDGSTAETLWHVSGPAAASSQSSPALANLDPSNDALEIVYYDRDRALVVLAGDGVTELARFPNALPASYGSPSVHDLDLDGRPEIILGARAFAFEPSAPDSAFPFELRSLFNAAACNTAAGAFSVVANLDDDPELEITCGGVAYDTDGTILWPDAGAMVGYAAVADFNLDGRPEVVMVRAGELTVRDGATGALLMGPGGAWFDGEIPIPGGGQGGPPTIADFDGDGLPEISAAGQNAYAVYDPDCVEPRIPGREAGACERDPDMTGAMRWSRAVQDNSSSRTGSSVYDFQGDGVAEIIYADECFLRVFHGRDGSDVLLEPFANSSRTGAEYPIVVDVDRDGSSEIVLVAGSDQIERDNCRDVWMTAFGYEREEDLPERFRDGTQGVYILGDPANGWVPTRPIWNQYAYAVTHVDAHGNVPASAPENWTVPGLNNFRQNVQGTSVLSAPNLTVELTVVAACGRDEVRLSALVRNEGSRGAPAGVLVELVQTAPAPETVIATALTTTPLLPGGSERVTVVAPNQPFDTALTFLVRVDGDEATSTIAECNEEDNHAAGESFCADLP